VFFFFLQSRFIYKNFQKSMRFNNLNHSMKKLHPH